MIQGTMVIVSIINYCYFHQKCCLHVLTQRAETPIADTPRDLVPLRQDIGGVGAARAETLRPARRNTRSLESTGKQTGGCWGEQAGPKCRAEVSGDVLGLGHTEDQRRTLGHGANLKYAPQSVFYNCSGQTWGCIL